MSLSDHPEFERAVRARCSFILFELAMRLNLATDTVDFYAAKTFWPVYAAGWDAFHAKQPAHPLLASEPFLHDVWLGGWQDAARGRPRRIPPSPLYVLKDS